VTQPKDNAKSVHARVQVFNAVSQEWVDVGTISSTQGNRLLVDIGTAIAVSISGVISATIEASAIVSAIQVKDTFTSAGSGNARSLASSADILARTTATLSGRTFMAATPTTATIWWGFHSSVTVANGTPIQKNQTATWDFEAGTTVDVYAVASSTADVRVIEQ